MHGFFIVGAGFERALCVICSLALSVYVTAFVFAGCGAKKCMLCPKSHSTFFTAAPFSPPCIRHRRRSAQNKLFARRRAQKNPKDSWFNAPKAIKKFCHQLLTKIRSKQRKAPPIFRKRCLCFISSHLLTFQMDIQYY